MCNWIKCIAPNLPEPYEKVLVQFRLDNSPMKHVFIAYRDNEDEWNLYYLYHSFPVDKTKLIPLYWSKYMQPPEE